MNKNDRVNERWLGRTAAITGLAVVVLAVVGLAPSPVRGLTAHPPSEQVDKIFTDWIRPDSPGCALAVMNDGTIIYKRGYGLADLDHKIPITPGTVFHAASLSKQFTAMSVMLLVRQGGLSLDDDVRKYLPQFHLKTKVTVGDMLRHISGIRDQWALATMAGWRLSDDLITENDVLNFVTRMKELNFKPREAIGYSNTNYTLAALIVQKVSGHSLPEFAAQKIFGPLRMENTRFGKTPGPTVKDRAYGYWPTEHGFVMRLPNYDLSGPTNLLTTVEDLARWDRNFDDKTVGGAAPLSQMQTAAELSNGKLAVLPSNGDDIHYGLGLTLSTYKGLNIVEHNGRDAGYRADLIRFPDQHFSVACLCNVKMPDDKLPQNLARQVADLYLADQLAQPTYQIAAHPAVGARQQTRSVRVIDFAEYIGRYYSEEIDTAYDVERDGSSLVIKRSKYPPTRLDPDPETRDVFTMENFSAVLQSVRVAFRRDPRGQVAEFLMDDDAEDLIHNFQFTKIKPEDNPKR